MAESEECAFAEGVSNFDFDKNLGAYPMGTLKHW
jgi:hypothetical protein